MQNSGLLAIPGIALLEGGLPIITKDGEHIGSIGISGANPELDGICAQAALDALKDDL
jgi:glc operon protein GlcG